MRYHLTRHLLAEVAEQLNSLAENDRDAGHYSVELRNVLAAWSRHRLPGYRKLAARQTELEAIVDEIPFGLPSARENRRARAERKRTP